MESRFHHKAEKGFQATFHRDVKSLVQVFEDLGNPFDKEGTELTVLNTKVVADEEGVSRMQQIGKTGMKQCDTFIKERLIERKTPLREPITRNKLSFFETPAKKKSSKAQQQPSFMKSDCSFFPCLFIACQIRKGDLDEFFKHENQACPPSLAEDGQLRLPRQKSNLASSLQLLRPQRT